MCYIYARLTFDALYPKGTAGTLTLLGSPLSTYVRTARMGFAEKGVAITLQRPTPRATGWLAGARLSFADLFVAPILYAIEQFPEGRRLLTDMPAIRRAQAVIRQRPSFVTTAPQPA